MSVKMPSDEKSSSDNEKFKKSATDHFKSDLEQSIANVTKANSSDLIPEAKKDDKFYAKFIVSDQDFPNINAEHNQMCQEIEIRANVPQKAQLKENDRTESGRFQLYDLITCQSDSRVNSEIDKPGGHHICQKSNSQFSSINLTDDISLHNRESSCKNSNRVCGQTSGLDFRSFRDSSNQDILDMRYSLSEKKYAQIVNKDWIPHFQLPEGLFDFPLDTFQLQASYLISKGKSVLVTAHTGTGKTAIVEYAIYCATNCNSRIIYTSPLKALSNQKFYEFRKFGSGIITGDISINPDSDILIMTTEILQNMLYSQNPSINNLQYVVFDEVHYIDNPTRGVVWEECLIMLPSHVTIILLSAGVPNASVFAEWVGKIRSHDVYIVSTAMRAVPLKYFVLEDYEVVPLNEPQKSKNTQILSDKFSTNQKNLRNINMHSDNSQGAPHTANLTLKNYSSANKIKPQTLPHSCQKDNEFQDFSKLSIRDGRVSFKQPQGCYREVIDQKRISTIPCAQNTGTGIIKTFKQPFLIKKALLSILKYVITKKQTPTIFFCFSRKKCQEFAKAYCRSLINEDEKNQITEILKNSVYKKLTQSEQAMEQVKEIISLLGCGVGVHHSGLLPILKEIVEILFSKKLLKIIFATETFSIGVNFPAKTVVFLGLTKRESNGLRLLNHNEFLQISGRAGRRNLDKIGNVIVCPDHTTMKNIRTVVHTLLKSKTNLASKFKISYNMILNIVRLNRRVEDFLKLSFNEYFNQRFVSLFYRKYEFVLHLLEELKSYHEKLTPYQISIPSPEHCLQLFEINSSLDEYSKDIKNHIHHSPIPESTALKGQICEVHVFCDLCKAASHYSQLLVDISKLYQKILRYSLKSLFSLKGLSLLTQNGSLYSDLIYNNLKISGKLLQKGESFQDFIFSDLKTDYKIKSQYTPIILLTQTIDVDQNHHFGEEEILFEEIFAIYFNGSLFTDFTVDDPRKALELAALKKLTKSAIHHHLSESPDFNQHFKHTIRTQILRKELKELENHIGDEGISTYKEFTNKTRILKKYNFIGNENNILLKGRIACEIKSADCILFTELLINNCFKDLSFEKIICIIVSMVSCEKQEKFVEDTISSEVEMFWSDSLSKIYEVVDVRLDNSIAISEFIFCFYSKYIDAVYDWCKGSDLCKISANHSVELGSFLRLISLLIEICRECIAAANVINDEYLSEKFLRGIDVLKNDSRHFDSLYYSQDIDSLVSK